MNYGISNANGEIYVITVPGNTIVPGGPYKTEESAKRRIRDLKRKAKIRDAAYDIANFIAIHNGARTR